MLPLKAGPKIDPKKIARRNAESNAGARPMWVQMPILERRKGKYSIFASATVSTHRGAAKYRKHTDKFSISATILRKGQAAQTTPVYDKKVTLRPKKNGLVTARIPITKSAAKKVKTLESQKARILMLMVHAKDTFPKLGSEPDVQQYVPGTMTIRKLTKQQVRRKVALNRKVQRMIEQDKPRSSSAASANRLGGATLARRTYQQLPRTALFVYNNTPFTQHVVIQPNVACMSGGLSGEGLQGVGALYNVDVPPTGVMSLFSAQVGSGSMNQPWLASTTGNPASADGGAAMVESMSELGRSVLNKIGDEMWTPEFYSSKGLIAAGLNTGVDLIVGALTSLYKSLNQCNTYGQYWAVTATAKMVGSPSQPGVILGTPATWAQSRVDDGAGIETADLGPAANRPGFLPNPYSTEGRGMQAILNSAVGQQTAVTYFDNAGMSAPIANGGNNGWNGHAAYSQGLVQYIYPNMPACVNNNCDDGIVRVQLGYLMQGINDVVGPKLLQSPTATAKTITDPNTGESAIHLECQIQNNGNFSNPFGGSTSAGPTSIAVKELNALPTATSVDQAIFTVTYWAQDAAGNYLYSTDSVTNRFPGPIVASPGAPPPNLKDSGDGTQTVRMDQPMPTALDLSQADLDKLVDPSTGYAAEPTKFGCAVIPVVSWKNMNVADGSEWGGRWPFPQSQTDTWLSSSYKHTFEWPNPVTALNVTWTGDTYFSDPVPSPRYASAIAESVTPASGPVTGDTNVTISGTGFTFDTATVKIGGVPCTNLVVVDAETMTCTTGPASAADVGGQVEITNPLSKEKTTSKDLFAYTSLITGVSPNSGTITGGTTITITGVGFGRKSTVMVGGKACTKPTVVSTTQITCVTPSHPEATVDVEVTNPRPQSTSKISGAFTFAGGLPALQITAVYGSNLTTAGAKDITIYGPQLTNAATVTVGGKPCTNVRQFGTGVGTSDNYIACVAPSQPAPGTYDVVVTMTGYQPATVTNGLTYQ
jgi:hypothetical protein